MEETLVRGKYYLGDPSYVLDEDLYYEVLGDKHSFESGKYDLKNDDTYMVLHNTHNGDGTFYDTKKRKYKVLNCSIYFLTRHFLHYQNLFLLFRYKDNYLNIFHLNIRLNKLIYKYNSFIYYIYIYLNIFTLFQCNFFFFSNILKGFPHL